MKTCFISRNLIFQKTISVYRKEISKLFEAWRFVRIAQIFKNESKQLEFTVNSSIFES